MESFLAQAFVYLAAAVVVVPIAKLLNLGSVLGYLIAGVLIGPVFGLVGNETEQLQHFAEFGVVMMLFLVGLELEPEKLFAMRRRLIGLGGLQVGGTAAAVTVIGMFCGLPWQSALAIGLTLALSSTAIVLQTLSEKSLMPTEGGQSSFQVLLFQDIAVIPILAIIPLLAITAISPETGDALQHAASTAAHGAEADVHHDSVRVVEGLSPILRTLLVIGAVATIVLVGHFLLRPFFKIIAKTELPELFTFSGLMLIIGIALLMYMVGLSPALGTFLAGVLLADSEFRHELESTIEPFKGILLGIFFITVGAGIDFSVLSNNLSLIIGITLGLILLKALVLLGISIIFNIRTTNRWLFALALAQAGEFGFVLVNFSRQNHAITAEMGSIISLVIALSMMLTPALFILYERWVVPKVSRNDEQLKDDDIDEQGSVILLGAGRFGQIIYRLLSVNDHDVVVIDNRMKQVEMIRRFGFKTFYGDGEKPELLQAAGIATAKLLIVAIDDKLHAVNAVKYVKKTHPKVHIIARAFDRTDYYELKAAGADTVIRETFHSSLLAAKEALERLGMVPHIAERQVKLFREMDEDFIDDFMTQWSAEERTVDNPEFRAAAARAREHLNETLRHDQEETINNTPKDNQQASIENGESAETECNADAANTTPHPSN